GSRVRRDTLTLPAGRASDLGIPAKRRRSHSAVLEQRGPGKYRRRSCDDRQRTGPHHPHPNPPPSRGRAFVPRNAVKTKRAHEAVAPVTLLLPSTWMGKGCDG